MWLNSLKIAIIEKNPEALEGLLNEMPSFTNLEDMKSAQALLKEANKFMLELKSATSTSMSQMKKNIDFLNATSMPPSNMLDIKS